MIHIGIVCKSLDIPE